MNTGWARGGAGRYTGEAGVVLPVSIEEFTAEYFTLATAAATGDPGSRLVAPLTQDGAGGSIKCQLTGGWSTTDPFGNAPYVLWAVKNVAGLDMASAALFSLACQIRNHGAGPGDSSNADVGLFLLNETNPSSATVDGIGIALRWSSATRQVISVRVPNGVGSITISGTDANLISHASALGRYSAGATGAISLARGSGLDLNNAELLAITGVSNVVANRNALWYLGLFWWRDAATAGNVTMEVGHGISPDVGIQFLQAA